MGEVDVAVLDGCEHGVCCHLLGCFFGAAFATADYFVGYFYFGGEVEVGVWVVDARYAVCFEEDFDVVLLAEVDELAFEVVLTHFALSFGYAPVVGDVAEGEFAHAGDAAVEENGGGEGFEGVARYVAYGEVFARGHYDMLVEAYLECYGVEAGAAYHVGA